MRNIFNPYAEMSAFLHLLHSRMQTLKPDQNAPPDLGPYIVCNTCCKSTQTDTRADDNCCDWQITKWNKKTMQKKTQLCMVPTAECNGRVQLRTKTGTRADDNCCDWQIKGVEQENIAKEDPTMYVCLFACLI